jgi:hypothetical protein
VDEILPGVVHWRTRHPNIRSEVDCWWLPGSLMDDPPETRRGLLGALRRLLDEVPDFRHVLMAHGGPVLDEGRAELESLVAEGGRTAFEY